MSCFTSHNFAGRFDFIAFLNNNFCAGPIPEFAFYGIVAYSARRKHVNFLLIIVLSKLIELSIY